MEREKSHLAEQFGENTFSFEIMKEKLPGEFFEKMMFAIRHDRPISKETADVVAHAMREWAISRGATHYTHWFQPLTGLTAEKHDSFLSYNDDGKIIDRFTGRQLIMSEPDASSFPHGGLRSTFEARGYAAWDPSSPAFLMKRGEWATLCLPSVYVSFTGEILDKKTPLLRSVRAVDKASVKMLRQLGNKRVTSVMPYLGAEQEYFLVDKKHLENRTDLREVGVTLLGAGPARGQQLEDHYFRAIPDRVLTFMEAVEGELVRLGVPVKTRHNEVAPAQFELAVLHTPVNTAVDQNQLVMEILKRVASKHGLEALLHEKPFARVNGSGKHNNWSLIDSEGNNLLEPGNNRSSKIRFLVFLMAVVWGVHRHEALLRGLVAGAGNDMRLGGHEAPPAIMSVHLGGHLNNLLDNLATAASDVPSSKEEIVIDLAGVARIPKDNTDRNRTSPFAFTGNKFEFRAVGSSAAVSLPNAVMNAMTAESLDMMCERLNDKLKETDDRDSAVLEMLSDIIQETAPVRFDGDNYTDQWAKEASRRGLKAARTTPEALDALILDSTFDLFKKYGLMNRQETRARHTIRLEFYAKTITVELKVLRQMIATKVLPAAIRHQSNVATSLNQAASALGVPVSKLSAQYKNLTRTIDLVNQLIEHTEKLSFHEDKLFEGGSVRARALYCAEKVRPAMAAVREISDMLECVIEDRDWPMSNYDEMLII